MRDNETKTNAETGTRVMIQQVANGAFSNVNVRNPGGLLYTYTYPSHEHFKAWRDYQGQCKTHDAR